MSALTKTEATQIRRIARKLFNENWNGREHPSFAASAALEAACDKFGYDAYGTSGEAFGTRSGIEWVETGDIYDMTVYALTDGYSCRFCVGSVGDYLERHPAGDMD